MGLGSYPGVSLAIARERALTARRQVADVVNPIATRWAERNPTFAAVVDEFMKGTGARSGMPSAGTAG